jgi:type II secretory pathway pseudopilin PulG
MTLIEVLIVLALLAGLAGMTLTFVGDLDDDSRMTRTRTQAEEMRRAVLGDGLEAGRFLADMGRLPVVRDAGSGRPLSEFFECPADARRTRTTLTSMQGAVFPADGISGVLDEVSLYCGWAGPYLLTSGARLYDGFGNEWYPNDVAVIGDLSVGDFISSVVSRGRDNAPGGDGSNADSHIAFNEQTSSASLTVDLVMLDQEQLGEPAWKPVSGTDSWATYPTWTDAPASCPIDFMIRSGDSKYLLKCVTSGAKGGSEPAPWEADHIGDRTTDGSAEWMLIADRSNYADRVRVALFVPFVEVPPNSTPLVRALLAQYDGTPPTGVGNVEVKPTSPTGFQTPQREWTAHGSVTFSDLTPGPRKLYAYAFISAGGTRNAWASPLLDVVLKPGGNVMTVYLTERLE